MGKGVICGKGINDMPKGWTRENEWNYRVYNVWRSMIQRCYSEKYHERRRSYIGCSVCERWLYLSNFVEDIIKIPNYEYWRDNPNQRISLDKDIKSNNKNKCYCLEQCQFVTKSENTKQSHKTRDYEQFTGENNPMYDVHRYGEKAPNHRKVVSVDPITKQIVFIWQYKKQATDFYSISKDTLNYYLKGKRKSGHEYNDFLWYYEEDYKQMYESH